VKVSAGLYTRPLSSTHLIFVPAHLCAVAGEATSSASGQIDLHLAAPLSLDAFLTKLHDKSTRQLRITIERYSLSLPAPPSSWMSL
jgi:hypothetical protein